MTAEEAISLVLVARDLHDLGEFALRLVVITLRSPAAFFGILKLFLLAERPAGATKRDRAQQEQRERSKAHAHRCPAGVFEHRSGPVWIDRNDVPIVCIVGRS